MRPILLIVFVLIFSSATLIWIMNDPAMESWQHGPVLSRVAHWIHLTEDPFQPTTSSMDNKNQNKPPHPLKRLADLERQSSSLAAQLSSLTAQLNQLESTMETNLSSYGARLEPLEAAVTQINLSAHDARLESLEETMTQQKEQADQRGIRLDTLENLPQLRMESGIFSADKEDKRWKLANMFSKKRVLAQRIEFSAPFKAPPRVVLGLIGIELSEKTNNFQLSAVDVDSLGFTLQFETKSEERADEVSIDWAAFGR